MESATEQWKTHLTLSKAFVHIALFVFPAIVIYAQDDQLYRHKLDENKWEEIRKNIRYESQPDGPGRQWTYESNEEYRKEQKKYGNQNGNGSGGNGQGDGGRYDGSSPRNDEDYEYTPPPSPSTSVSPSVFSGLGALGYVFLGIFIVLLAVLIFYLFVNNKKDGKKIVQINLDEQAPSEIPLSELQRLLQEALSKGDYRGAIRIYFIFIIRDLSQKNWIQWEKDKTNFQYLREMNGKSEYNLFNQSVGYFEIIWYGKREIDQPTFEKIKPEFTRLLDKLGVK